MNKRNFLGIGGLSLTLLLVACGGGGGGGDATPSPTPPVPPSTKALQGLWQSTSANGSTTAAVALPDGRLWAVLTDVTTTPPTTRLVKAKLSGQEPSFTGAAKGYTFATSATAPVNVTLSANVVEKVSLNGSISSGGVNEAYSLAYLSRYDTPAVLAQHAGAWNATLGNGVLSWVITATGALSGTRTTGCTYSGQLALRAENKAVVDVAIAESCAGTVTPLQGVGVLSADKSRISMFLTSADEASAVVLSLAH